MPILLIDPIHSTTIFIVVFVAAIILSLGRKKNQDVFPLELTQELKGLAILAIVFSHVGYFLSSSRNFLFPLSIMGGVGVNLFLFLSGFGLTTSASKEKIHALKFYKKRLLKLFTPFWIVSIIIFLLDFFLLHISYPSTYIIHSLLGYFPRADLFLDINSPFWFFTPILFYYLIFPLSFFQKRLWLTAIIIYVSSYVILQFKIPVSTDVLHLYKLHLLAFPLGVAFASFLLKPHSFSHLIPAKIRLVMFDSKLLSHYVILFVLLILIAFFGYNSGVGETPFKEQATSLVTMGLIIIFFMMKKIEFRLFYLFGLFSFEIYLIHWPVMSRYDVFFNHFPAWLALIFYLIFFLLFARLLQYVVRGYNNLLFMLKS